MGPPEIRIETPGVCSVDLLTADECRRLVEILAQRPEWAAADVRRDRRTGARSIVPSVRRVRSIRFEDPADPRLEEWGLAPFVARILDLALAVDADRLGTGLSRVQEVQALRYEPGDHYTWHVDSTDRSWRTATALAYLSDRRTTGLAGGETVFATSRWRRRRIRPRLGRVLVFDAFLRHRAARVRRGLKYALAVLMA